MQIQNKKMLLILFSLVIFFLLLFFVVVAFPNIISRTSEENQETLEAALHRANIQCYAIEGRYAPNIAYLEEHYGIVIDHSKFKIFYDSWADNIMPEITIIHLDSLEEDAYETE